MSRFFIPFLFLLLFLVACQPQTVTVEKDGEVEVIEIDEDSPSAIGSEDDSGALPPPINSGSKVSASQVNDESPSLDVLFILESSTETAVSVSELEENWESIIQQVNALPRQPEVQYAALISDVDESSFTFTDFAPAPFWDDLVNTNDNSFENISDAAAQLSWTETESQQLVFILVSSATFDDTFLIGTENSFYFPIIPQDLDLSEEMVQNFEAMMNGVNGRLITQDNNQTNLSEQLILAIAERIILPNETSANSGEENE